MDRAQREIAISPTDETASSYASRKARFGHRDWLVWNDATGKSWAALKTLESLERAIREKSDKDFMLYVGSTATPCIVDAGQARIMLANARRGYL
jgi:hypothetical protein